MYKPNCKKEWITCPVCSDLFDKPMKLNCQHTVCGKCINWTGDSLHKFICPVCGSTGKDAVRDHGKQALLQMHHKHTSLTVHIGKQHVATAANQKDMVSTNTKVVQSSDIDAENNNTSPLKCQTCLVQSKNVEWKCKECEKVFCNGCKSVHDSIPNCNSHYVQTIHNTAEDIKSTAKQYQFMLSNKEKENAQHLDNFLKYRNQMDKVIEEALGKIDEHQDMSMNMVKDHHNSLRDSVHDVKARFKEQLDKDEGQMQSVQGEIRRNQERLSKLVDTKESVMVVYLEGQKGEEIEKFVDNLETIVPRDIQPQCIDIQVNILEQPNIKKTIAVNPVITYMEMSQNQPPKSTEANFSDQVDTSTTSPAADYSDLLKRVYKPEKSISLQYSPRRLRIIDDQIWCAGTAALYVYRKTGSIVKTITHDQIKQVKAITLTASGDVIVACWDKQGLLQLDKTGEFQCCLSRGNFSDVVSCRNILYALSYQDTTVHQFTLSSDNKWEPKREIKMNYNNGNNWDSLYAHVNTIHVCSWANNCIYHYNLMGQVLSQYGSKTNTSSGHFNHPRICDADQFGNLLVVDTDNHKIQVQDSSGNWGYVTHTADIKRPIDVVVDDATGDLWLIQNIPGETHRLHKLVQKQPNLYQQSKETEL